MLCLIAAVMLAATCRSSPSSWRPTPGADFEDARTATPEQWRRYVERLSFGSGHLRGDSLVMSDDSGRSVIHFSSEDGAAAIPDRALARGRIIARAVRTGAPGPYRAPEGESYVWVDSTGDGWRWFFVSREGQPGPSHPMVLGAQAFPLSSNSGVHVAFDTFPNGRCGRVCCLWFLTYAQAQNAALVRRVLTEIHDAR